MIPKHVQLLFFYQCVNNRWGRLVEFETTGTYGAIV